MMVASLSSADAWVAVVAAVAGLVLGTILSALYDLTDRIQLRQVRRGDLAAVGLRHDHWYLGQKSISLTDVGDGRFIDSVEAACFPVSVTNGSGEKITNVEFGVRWREEGGEIPAGFAGVLLPDEVERAEAAEAIPPDWEAHEFDQDWLDRLDYFVRFTDQRGKRHENMLRHRPTPQWTSREIT